MVLIAFVGELGAGKTLALTYLAWRNYNKGQTIYANYHLGFPFKLIDSPEKIEEMREGFFAGDELWNWCDCVSDDTKIMTHNDAINVSDCINANPVQSVCFDTMKIENSNISHVLKRLPEKNEKIILLKTSTKSLKASKNHRLFKFDGLQLRESLLKDLKAGDYILTADAVNPAIKKEYGKFSEIDYMRKIMNSSMLLEKITSIREIRPKGYLYDLSVPSHENYIANGIVVHNSRVSGSKKNKLISAILLKSRKRGINIGYTAQHLSQVDKRMRNITDFIAVPQLTPQETWCRLRVYHAISGQLIKMYKFETAPIFKMYKTEEEVKDLSWA